MIPLLRYHSDAAEDGEPGRSVSVQINLSMCSAGSISESAICRYLFAEW